MTKVQVKSKNLFDQVYRIVEKVPAGKVMTYGQVAQEVNSLSSSTSTRGISPQLVGWALHANKSVLVPCHRVVTKDGRLADNFAFSGWKEQKHRLEAEGVTFLDEKHVDMKRHLASTADLVQNNR